MNYLCLDAAPFWIFSLLAACTFGVGLLDDVLKFTNYNTKGLGASHKVLLISLSLSGYFFLGGLFNHNAKTICTILRLVKHIPIVLCLLSCIFHFCSSSYCARSKTYQTGLDGLATSLTIVTLTGLMFACYYLGTDNFHNTNLMFTLLVIVSVLLTFFYFNKYPAVVFLGDSGSFLLGSVISLGFLSTGLGLLLPFFGMVFVLETFSVILQVIWFKSFGKRIFKCAPIHHHFQFMGCHESKITFMMILIQLLSVVFFSHG